MENSKISTQTYQQVYKEQQFFSEVIIALDYRRKIPSVCYLLKRDGCSDACVYCSRTFWGRQNLKSELLVNYETELSILKENIGNAVFGESAAAKKSENDFTGYEGKQLTQIKKIFKAIMYSSEPDLVRVCPVFVHFVSSEGQIHRVAVFRIPMSKKRFRKPKSTYSFVDDLGRCYNGWEDYLCSNELPKGLICYPQDGIYSHNDDMSVKLDWRRTPSCKLLSRIGRGLDLTSAVGSTVGALLVFTPASAAVCAGILISSTVYAVGRNISSLVNRVKHKQSIKPTDSDALDLWLDSATSASSCVMGCTMSLLKAQKLSLKHKPILMGSTVVTMGCHGLNLILQLESIHSDLARKAAVNLLSMCGYVWNPSNFVKLAKVVEERSVLKICKHVIHTLSMKKNKAHGTNNINHTTSFEMVCDNTMFDAKIGEMDLCLSSLPPNVKMAMRKLSAFIEKCWECKSFNELYLLFKEALEMIEGAFAFAAQFMLIVGKITKGKGIMGFITAAKRIVHHALQILRDYWHNIQEFKVYKNQELVKLLEKDSWKEVRQMDWPSFLSDKLGEEELFAIPDHLLASGKVQVTKEQYLEIGRNKFAIPKADPTIQIINETSAYLYFDNVGFVVIKTDPVKRMVIVRTAVH